MAGGGELRPHGDMTSSSSSACSCVVASARWRPTGIAARTAGARRWWASTSTCTPRVQGIVCELCSPLRREHPVATELVRHSEHGHTVRLTRAA